MTIKLPTEFKQKWLEALRSGKYKRTMGALRETWDMDNEVYSYCCLGVACDIAGAKWKDPDGDGVSWETERDSKYMPAMGDVPDDVFAALDQPLPYELSPPGYAPVGVDRTYMGALAHLNDGGWDFNQIADWIEREL